MIAQEQLSNDTNELKAIVCQLIGVVEEQKILIANQNQRIESLCQKNEEQSQKIDEQSLKIEELTHQVSILKRHRFGKRSEKLNEDNETTPDNSNEAIEPPNSLDAHT